jgi:outer membrane receptor protein involved in Fe transport
VPIQIVDNRNLLQATYGLYAQDRWQILPRLALDYGLRWDQLIGFIHGSELSPRIGVTYQLKPGITMLHAGAAIYFVPPPAEFLATEDIDRFLGTTAQPPIRQNSPPKPMTQYFFDIGIDHALPFRLQLGVDAFFELERNVLDEGQFGSSLIFAPVNYQHGRIYGAQATASYDSASALSAYLNFAYTVAEANKVVSGQFNFEPAELAYIDRHYISLDQGQLFTASAGFTYRWRDFLVSTAITVGSGLRTGFANTAMMPPYAQVDASLGRSVTLRGVGNVDGRLIVVNLFDRIYQFHNGSGIGVGDTPQYMPRRALYFDVKLPLSTSRRRGANP